MLCLLSQSTANISVKLTVFLIRQNIAWNKAMFFFSASKNSSRSCQCRVYLLWPPKPNPLLAMLRLFSTPTAYIHRISSTTATWTLSFSVVQKCLVTMNVCFSGLQTINTVRPDVASSFSGLQEVNISGWCRVCFLDRMHQYPNILSSWQVDLISFLVVKTTCDLEYVCFSGL